MQGAGLPTTFAQKGDGDKTPPQLVAFDFVPKTVDVSAAAATITVTARITDDIAGNAGAGYTSSQSQVRFIGPTGQFVDALLSGFERISGTPNDGVYQYAMQVPRAAAKGTWRGQSLLLVDQVGNTKSLGASDLQAAGFPTTFAQTGDGDTTAPQLVAFDFVPKTVDVSAAAATITVTARITDDIAGNAGAGYTSSPSQGRFIGPTGQFVDALLSGFERISGTPNDGVYQYAMQVPRAAAKGTWRVQSLLLVDQVGNTKSLGASDLQAAGFPTTFAQTGDGDTTAPQLVAFDFVPKTVDVSASAATITVTARITDDIAGNAGAGYTSSPSQVRFIG